MNIALCGLAASGKTTLFSSFLGSEGNGSAPKTAIGIVKVPDQRLEKLSQMYHPRKSTEATVNFMDLVPLNTPVKQEKSALLETLKTADALLLITGAYRWGTVKEVLAEVNKLRLEVIIQDLDFIVKRQERLEKELKASRSESLQQKEQEFLLKLQLVLEQERFLNQMQYDPQEQALLSLYNLITARPVCYIINVSDAMDESMITSILQETAEILVKAGDQAPLLSINAKLESEIAMLPPADRENFMVGFGIGENGRDRVIRTAYELLNLISFFTVGEDECRAWSLHRGEDALKAAGAIHSDLARGFIRAEVIEHDLLLELGSLQEAKKVGKLRLEGKTYFVKDGDIVHILFNC